jgi:hypothetical protein
MYKMKPVASMQTKSEETKSPQATPVKDIVDPTDADTDEVFTDLHDFLPHIYISTCSNFLSTGYEPTNCRQNKKAHWIH